MLSGVVCVVGCNFWSSDSREEVAIGSVCVVVGGVVGFLGEARLWWSHPNTVGLWAQLGLGYFLVGAFRGVSVVSVLPV